MSTSSAWTPDLLVRWFHAVDVPKQDETPFRSAAAAASAAGPKVPATWKTFSGRDSANLEAAYQQVTAHRKHVEALQNSASAHRLGPVSTKVAVNEDQLFEADVEKLETYPVYWQGPTYDIRRGTWFYHASGGNYLPCDENLSRQLEDGYRKFQPWKAHSTNPSTAPLTSISSATSPAMPGGPPPRTQAPAQEQRWALFGPYMNQYVIYEGAHTAIQFSDDFGSKIGRAVMNIGGTRLTRGWDEVEKLRTKSKAQLAKEKERETKTKEHVSGGKGKAPAEKEGESDNKNGVETDHAQKAASKGTPTISSMIADMTPTSSTNALNSEQADKLQEKTETEDYDEEEDGDRPINHLVLVIHGIGQKLGERVEAVNFIHDCNILRRTVKESSQQYATAKDQLKFSKRAGLIDMPDHGGVQILPVQWRQKIQFGMARKPKTEEEKNKEPPSLQDLEATLDDITLEGVPSIRQLVSDVVLDVLLYMSPRYRQEMIKHVTEELNRIYRLFRKRNPRFNGKVSVLGHSLGSLLAFDILCNQPHAPRSAHPSVDLSATTGVPDTAKRPVEVDLTDLLHGAMNADDRKVTGLMERSSMRYTDLEFSVDRLFVVGSPVGLFLLLKGDKIQARKPGMSSRPGEVEGLSSPAVNALYNIFHPHDPVAYRIEPVIDREFAAQKPVPIPYTKGGLKGTIVGIQDLGNGIADRGRSMLEAATRGITSTKAVVTSGLTSSMGRVLTVVSSIHAFKAVSPSGTVAGSHEHLDHQDDQTGHTSAAEHHANLLNATFGLSSPPSSTNELTHQLPTPTSHEPAVEMREIVRANPASATDVERLNPRGRIDYVLQEGVLENPYISALGVHMNYWGDPDCALFMLRELYCEISPEDVHRGGGGGPSGGSGGGGNGGRGDSGSSPDRKDGNHGATRAPPRNDSGDGSGSTATKPSGLTQLVRDTTSKLSGMTLDDIVVLKSQRIDWNAPLDFASGNVQPLDAYALLHVVVSLITNLILTGIRLASLLVIPIFGSKPS
ncbi:hypothetical protein HKX48_007915 [Thoreauomyces humboldtii]|nr:hypothetical protein HKX48_007915 [Thoreauomyces humboldtii]